MTRYRRRDYAGAADLRRMQDVVAAVFPASWWCVGDLAWAARDRTHRENALWVKLWEDSRGALAGWTWSHVNGSSDVFAAPHAQDAGLLDAMVETVVETYREVRGAGDPVDCVSVLAGDDEPALAEALARAGFAALAEPSFVVNRRSLAGAPPAPSPPPGYRLTHVGDALVDGRVEAQRAAFTPSTLTARSYARVRRTWPYRPELDRVVVSDAGEVVAFCTAWLDDRNGAGLLEPVGTRPTHQRRGLGAAVCLDAIAALRDAGATVAQVSCEAGSAGCATYRAAGFTPWSRAGVMRRALG